MIITDIYVTLTSSKSKPYVYRDQRGLIIRAGRIPYECANVSDKLVTFHGSRLAARAAQRTLQWRGDKPIIIDIQEDQP